MKRILLVIVFVICFSGVANAQCAWVLWERSEFSAKEEKNNSYTGWHIVGAYPTAKACLQTEEDICMKRKELDSKDYPNQDPLFRPKEVKCFGSWGGHMVTWYNGMGNWMSEWKCLPDTVDPRK